MSENAETRFNFTLKRLASLPLPATGRKEYHDVGCPSLTVIVTAAGAKTFHRYGRVNGRPQRFRIGTFPEYSVDSARTACAILTGKIAKGEDPGEERQKRRNEKTLADLWDWYLKHHSKPHKRTWKADERVWNKDLSHLGRRRISTLSRAEVTEIRDATIERHKNKPGPGRKVLELLSSMYAQAVDNEWVDKNPCYKVRKPPKPERSRFLQASELPKFFEQLALLQPRSRDFISLCLFTGARRQNVLEMRWDEIRWSASTWTIPKEKYKTKEDITLPLAVLAVEILARRFAENTFGSPWVFPSSASKTGHYVEPKFSWATLLKLAGLNNLRIHDLRRTLGSWQAEAGVSLQIIAKSLGHGSLESTEIYARLQPGPVREAVNKAVEAIKTAGKPANSENS